MRDADGTLVRVQPRVTGRAALERRLRAVHLAVMRFGRYRARAASEIRWAQRATDTLAVLLSEPPEAAGGAAGTRQAVPPAAPASARGIGRPLISVR